MGKSNADVEAVKPESDYSENESIPSRKNVAGYFPSKTIWILSCVSMYLGAFLFGLDTTIAADIQASILETFGDVQKLSWISVGFPMGSVAFIPIFGKLYGHFQIKWLALASFTVFEAASALCGGAPTMDALIVGRVLAGLGGAGCYLGVLNCMSAFATPEQQPLYIAGIGVSWGVGAILGPVIGGAFAVNQSTTWRWAFYINLPIAALQAPIYLFAFPKYNPQPNEAIWVKIKRVDIVGAALNISVITLFFSALNLSGSQLAWNSAGPIAIWVVFGVLATLYGVQQSMLLFTNKDQRMLPVHFLRSPFLATLFLVTLCVGAATATTIYFVPLLFQFTRGDSALQAAVRLLPVIIPQIVFMLFSGGTLPIFKRYFYYYFAGGALLVAGGAAMFTVNPTTSNASIYGFEFMLGVGIGLCFQISYVIASLKVMPEDVTNAVAFMNIAQIGGSALGPAVAGAIFQNVGFHRLKVAFAGSGIPDAVLKSGLAGNVGPLSQGPEELKQRVVEIIVHTLMDNFAIVFVGGSLVVICSFILGLKKLDFHPQKH